MNKPSNLTILLIMLNLFLCYLLYALVTYTVADAQEPVTCPQVCPACNVKAEWKGHSYQYEYTDNTAVITGTTPISVCWQGQGGYTVSSVCIKARQTLFYPDPSLGCWETPWQEISHIIVCTEKSTTIELIEFRAISEPEFSTMLFLIGCIGMLSGLCIIAWVERGRHELHTTRDK